MPELAKNKLVRYTAFALTGLVIVLVIGFGSLLGRSYYIHQAYVKPATSTAQTFLSDLFDGRAGAAYKMTSSASQKRTTSDQFAIDVTGYQSTSPVVTDTKLVLVAGRKAADYTANIQLYNRPPFLIHMHLVRVGSDWKVDSLVLGSKTTSFK